MNPIGVISMSYARPFTPAQFPLFARMKAAGMDFCEMLVPEEGEIDPAVAGSAARDAGLFLQLAARVNPQRELASDDASARVAGVDYLRRCIDIAVACGVTVVGGPLYGSPLVFAGRAPSPIDEAARRERVKRVTEGLRAAAEFAKGSGVRFAVEPLNRFETDFCNTARQAMALCTLVDHASVGIMLDTFHMNIEEDDLAQAIRLAGPLLIHFQANENHRGFLGTGHVDWLPICRALAEIDYQGAITLEPFRRTGHLLSLPLAQWRPPSHDEDADLRASGDFLRGALHAAGRQ
jgi:D-psicose/D-tagatose/L-ribulose 3-epimerase